MVLHSGSIRTHCASIRLDYLAKGHTAELQS